MIRVNELILEKLQKSDADTINLAKKALELAETYHEQAIADQLESIVRKMVKENKK